MKVRNSVKLGTIALATALVAAPAAITFANHHGSHDSTTEAASKNIVETAVGAGNFETLAAALGAAGLVDALADGDETYTVFAPTDAAFAKLPEGTVEALLDNPDALRRILLYHVVDGKVKAEDVVKLTTAETLLGGNVTVSTRYNRVYINNSRVTTADIEASNGVIHVVDTVLIPKTLVEVATEAGSFTTLAAALGAADLVETLNTEGEGQYTVFAPTDAAFAKLPEGTVESLLENPDQLRQILLYHVVPGRVMAADVVELDSAETAQGSSVSISAGEDGVRVNASNVVQTDVTASNGVIHVIDTVLIPETGI